MARRPASRRAQRGVALLGLLAVAVMVFAYVLTSRLNAASRFVGIDRGHNAKVLAQAKQALIGWMAMNAAGTDSNPGRLPCPEAPGYFGDPAQEGIAAGSCMPPNNVGRLPWRTLGLEKLVDAAGEPLWYAVSQGWSLPGASTTPINSDSIGQLSLDGVANDAVALVIAPGAVLSVQAGGGCTAWAQTRPVAGPPDLRNYLECGNAAASFVTSAAGQTLNDQVLRVGAADLIPALEAAIADRMQREIAPALRGVYTSSIYAGIPASTPLYPYAAPWANPGPGSGTSDYRGVASTYKGLLPFNQTQGCTAAASNPRCLPHPALIAYASAPGPATKTTSAGSIDSLTCLWESTDDVRVCDGRYEEDADPTQPIRVELAATFSNFAMGLRDFDTSGTHLEVFARNDTGGGSWSPVTPVTYTATMNSDGSVTLRFGAVLPNINDMGWGNDGEFRLRIERAVIGDHALLDPNNATLGWFVRNEWYRTTYYATVRRNTAVALSTLGCIDSSDTNEGCVRFNDSSTRNIRALLVLAGRSLSNPAGRPNAVLADYVEYQNCDWTGSVCNPQTLYEQRPMRASKIGISALNAPWNDRVILVDWRSSLIVPAQAVTTSPLRLATRP